MAQIHAESGQVVRVMALGEKLSEAKTTALLKAEQLEVLRVVLPSGKSMKEHRAPGDLTVHCLEGSIECHLHDAKHVLEPGDFIHLKRGVPHSLHALRDASALVTMVLNSKA